MKVVRTISEMRTVAEGCEIGFVPTMGAFHEGHLSLMRSAKKAHPFSVVSLFVNPTQFSPTEDLSKYPRHEARDTELAADAGVDVLFIPSADEIYSGGTTQVRASKAAELWEGALRPGHFDGVATVVLKLFNIVQPKCAFFGMKDLQQCAVVRDMVADLNLPVLLRFEPTMREFDGLAMSSRNEFLNREVRHRANSIYRELCRCAGSLMASSASPASVLREIAASAEALKKEGLFVDYFALVDTHTMEPTTLPSSETSLIAAVRVGTIRLIDNMQLA